MRTLNFKCDGQKLSKDGDFSGLVPGSKGYLNIGVRFDSAWKGFVQAAEFITPDGTTYPVLMKGGCCDVPDEVTNGTFSVRVVGKKSDQKIVTNKVKIRQEG